MQSVNIDYLIVIAKEFAQLGTSRLGMPDCVKGRRKTTSNRSSTPIRLLSHRGGAGGAWFLLDHLSCQTDGVLRKVNSKGGVAGRGTHVINDLVQNGRIVRVFSDPAGKRQLLAFFDFWAMTVTTCR